MLANQEMLTPSRRMLSLVYKGPLMFAMVLCSKCHSDLKHFLVFYSIFLVIKYLSVIVSAVE